MPRHARQSLADLVDGSHYDDLDKVIDYVHRQQDRLGQAHSSDETIKDELDKKLALRGKRGQGDVRKHYMHPIYANHYHQYQVDLLEQSHVKKDEEKDNEDGDDVEDGRNYPKFFFMAINTNTKYAYAFPLDGKDTASVLGALGDLRRKTGDKLRSIVSDEEAALNSDEVRHWLKHNHVGIHTIIDQNHTALAVVDRLIRTLRDMNTPTRYSKDTSTHRKYRDFTDKRMQHLLSIYNETKHEGTGHTPLEMTLDRKLETRFIIKRIYAVSRRKKITDFNLPVGKWVRYIIPRDPMKKARYKVSTERYQISAKAGNAYQLMAQDGSELQLSRWRLLPLDDALINNYKMGSGFRNKKNQPKGNGQIDKITGMRHGKAHEILYRVVWRVPDGATPKKTWETIANIRKDQPNKKIESPWEKEFNDKHTRKRHR
jgi:hypothetical protein